MKDVNVSIVRERWTECWKRDLPLLPSLKVVMHSSYQRGVPWQSRWKEKCDEEWKTREKNRSAIFFFRWRISVSGVWNWRWEVKVNKSGTYSLCEKSDIHTVTCWKENASGSQSIFGDFWWCLHQNDARAWWSLFAKGHVRYDPKRLSSRFGVIWFALEVFLTLNPNLQNQTLGFVPMVRGLLFNFGLMSQRE
jgi:hypothetical protein